MEVYKFEVQNGLADRIKNSRLAIACAINVKDVPEKEYQRVLASANPKQIDLFYFESILASVGWNANDAVFDKLEMWKARKSPVDKPVNYMHDQKDIIGHMTSASVIVDSKVYDDSNEEEVPEAFDIAVGSVLYKYWEDKDKKEKLQTLIKEIAEGKWYVSMECIFPKFDYAVITPDGHQKMIARNDDSSFLSSYLKFYGGTGEYQGHKIGMIMRDFVFSGKGIVNNPANKRSDITACSNNKEVSAFEGEQASLNSLNISLAASTIIDTNIQEEKEIMSKYTDEQGDLLVKELNDLKAKASEQEKKAVEALNSELAKATKSLEAVQLIADEKDKAIANLNEEVAKVQKELVATKAEIEVAKVEKQKVVRLNKLVAKSVPAEKAASLVEEFSSLTEELFDKLAASIVVNVAVEQAASEKVETVKTEEIKNLEQAVASAKTEEPKLTSETDAEKLADVLRASASSWIEEAFKAEAKKK